MQRSHRIKHYFFITFGFLEIVDGATFFTSSYLSDKSMGKDGIGDVDALILYTGLSGISFYCFLILLMLSIVVFSFGKKSLREIHQPIVFPASLPILWVPFTFFALYGTALFLLKL